MDIYQIRKLLVGLAVAFLVILLLVHFLNRPTNPLEQMSYTNSISGSTDIYYANKGLEKQPNGLLVLNSQALTDSLPNSSNASDVLAALKQFINTQSNYQSQHPVISQVSQHDGTYQFKLFIETDGNLYDVSVHFTGQGLAVMDYRLDTNETL